MLVRELRAANSYSACIRAGDEHFDRHATGIGAGATNELSLDQRDRHASCCQSAGMRRTGLSGADDYSVKLPSQFGEHEQRTGNCDRILDQSRRPVAAKGGR